jgi:hypothetical protein
MKYLGRVSLLAGAAVALAAPLALAQPTEAEFKCEAAVSKNGAKFVKAKAKCIDKCLTAFWKGDQPESDCLPPTYGGVTAECIDDTVLDAKGAQDKFRNAILKACDPATKDTNDCPECYSGGDCSTSGHATSQVQNIEGQVDSFVPGVACERAGADVDEQKCQKGTAKALVKQVGSVVKCYDKCKKNEFKGLVSPGVCDPPASDPATQACVLKGNDKATAAIDKICSPPPPKTIARPDCPTPDQYPSGAQWVNLVDIAISGNIPTTYCE